MKKKQFIKSNSCDSFQALCVVGGTKIKYEAKVRQSLLTQSTIKCLATRKKQKYI